MKLTPESFVNVVKKSGLIEPEQLKRHLQEFRQEGVRVDDSQEIAKAMIDRGLLTSWQAEKLLKGKHRGFFLGKYRLLSLLGKGGMSSVYLAEHVLMRRRCAIKVLPQKRVDDTSYLGRFHREAQAVASLDHPNIVRAYDVDVDRSVEKNAEIHFLVMEYVNGKSLQDLIEQQAAPNTFDFILAADYTRQAADGLAHAHQAGMVHRDIKPGNLLVDENGTVRILDLGLARFFAEGEDQSLTVAHDEKVLGTADYLAPEQALDSHNVDARADIYSLGCTCYFLLTGHAPFTEGTLAQRLMAHQTKEPPPIERDRPDTPPALVEIVNKLMAKKLEDRWQTAADASEALSAWLIANADDAWLARNPALVGSGSSITSRSSVVVSGNADTAITDSDSAARRSRDAGNVTEIDSAATEPVADVDGNDGDLAAFLSNLGAAEADGGKADGGKTVAPAAKEKSVTPARDSAIPPVVVHAPSAVPVADPVRGEAPAAKTVQEAVPVARAVSEPSAQVAKAVPVAEPVGTIQTAVPVVQPTARTAEAAPQSRSTSGTPWLQNSRNRIALIAVAVVLVIGGATWGALSYFGKKQQPKPDSSANDDGNPDGDTDGDGGKGTVVETGDILVGKGGKFSTIAAAIKEAKRRYDAGDGKTITQVIRVAGGKTYREQIVLDNFDHGIDELHLEILCEKGNPAVLAPRGTEPIIVLANVMNLLVDGFELKADKKPVAVKISQASYGTRLRNLKISGFTETGIQGFDLQGFTGTPTVLQNLTLKASQPNSDGVKFNGKVSGLNIDGCRFLGPMRNGVRFASDPTGVQISDSVFYMLDAGIVFDRQRLLHETKLRNNTFRELKTGIRFDMMPAQGSSKSEISRNVFSKITGPDVAVKARKPRKQEFESFLATDGMVGNMTDRKAPHANDIPFLHFGSRGGRVGVAFGFASTDPQAENFLLPTASAPQRGSGARPVRSR